MYGGTGSHVSADAASRVTAPCSSHIHKCFHKVIHNISVHPVLTADGDGDDDDEGEPAYHDGGPKATSSTSGSDDHEARLRPSSIADDEDHGRPLAWGRQVDPTVHTSAPDNSTVED
ncbi:unnamed protein product [Heligmosomoides polygyrus]|uniref:Uncharacterized protein n=1 Tax=Heligmosomoides polygyrus TaxID=6339 RepID=A0A183F8M7_HELPZ|nr:unnamed protein product [Heligmosomoides polygyrus]